MRHTIPETVAEVMSRSFRALEPQSSLDEAEAMLALGASRDCPVTRAGKLLGTVSLTDLIGAMRWLPRAEEEGFAFRASHAPRPEHSGRKAKFDYPVVTASGVMNRSPAVLGPDDDLASAGQVMLDERLSLLPVVDRSSVVGVLSMTDFVRLAVRVLREDAEAGACRVPVAAVMSSRPLVVARPRDSVSEVEQRMRRERVRHVPVADRDETVVGILSDRDVLAAMRSTTPHWAMKVASVMTPAPVTTTAGADAVAAATSMLRRAVGALPVTEHERLVGMLTKTDFLAYLVTRVTGGRRAHD